MSRTEDPRSSRDPRPPRGRQRDSQEYPPGPRPRDQDNGREAPAVLPTNEAVPPGPAYLYVKRVDGGSLRHVNPFQIRRDIQEATQTDVQSAKTLRSGALLVHTFTHYQTKRVLAISTLAKHRVTAILADSLNTAQGVLKCEALASLDNQEILQELAPQGVRMVERLRSRNPENPNPTIRVGFTGTSLPQTVECGYEIVQVDPWVPTARMCRNCWKCDHGTKWCRNPNPICGRCAGGHRTDGCQESWNCAHCGGPHPVWDKKCPFQEQLTAEHRAKTAQIKAEHRAKARSSPVVWDHFPGLPTPAQPQRSYAQAASPSGQRSGPRPLMDPLSAYGAPAYNPPPAKRQAPHATPPESAAVSPGAPTTPSPPATPAEPEVRTSPASPPSTPSPRAPLLLPPPPSAPLLPSPPLPGLLLPPQSTTQRMASPPPHPHQTALLLPYTQPAQPSKPQSRTPRETSPTLRTPTAREHTLRSRTWTTRRFTRRPPVSHAKRTRTMIVRSLVLRTLTPQPPHEAHAVTPGTARVHVEPGRLAAAAPVASAATAA